MQNLLDVPSEHIILLVLVQSEFIPSGGKLETPILSVLPVFDSV